MLCPNLLPLPVHARSLLVIDLHAVHADIALAAFPIAGDHAWQGDKSPGVLRPALQNREVEQREFIPANHFFARPRRHRFRKELAHLRQPGQHLHLVEKTLGRLEVHEPANTLRDFIQSIHS